MCCRTGRRPAKETRQRLVLGCWGFRAWAWGPHHDNDLGLWPLAMDALNNLGQGINICFSGDVVRFVIVIRADVDDDQVGSRVFAEVPGLGVVCDMAL